MIEIISSIFFISLSSTLPSAFAIFAKHANNAAKKATCLSKLFGLFLLEREDKFDPITLPTKAPIGPKTTKPNSPPVIPPQILII